MLEKRHKLARKLTDDFHKILRTIGFRLKMRNKILIDPMRTIRIQKSNIRTPPHAMETDEGKSEHLLSGP